MYKLLLCLRYLRTRYIALICIVSVTLGVATLIVVNSVMSGFTHEMQGRLNGILGDVIIESRSIDGVPDFEAHQKQINKVAGESIAGMSPTITVPALMYVDTLNGPWTKQVMLVGIDEKTYASVSDFGQYLQHQKNREQLEFKLRDGGYDVYDSQEKDASKLKKRVAMMDAGWKRRRQIAQHKKRLRQAKQATPTLEEETVNPFQAANDEPQGRDFDPAVDTHEGIVLGIGTCAFRASDASDVFVAAPGDDVKLSFPTATMPPDLTSENFTIVDIYESKMSEYDSQFVFVPLRALQHSRGMTDPTTKISKFTTIQIKLKEGVNADLIRDQLRDVFPSQVYMVNTWRDRQGPLLAAIQLETTLLNVLLFLIIAVAGFGILAIFYMIVVEKTRDIGILKSLGASGQGVLGIFLGYGLSLGIVGAGGGTILGLVIVAYIQEIADLIGRITGQPVFDPSVYYFHEIPTNVSPLTVTWVCAGAIFIAVMASIMPAFRAARLHPVKALRYE